jgi:hypothetical protein
MSKNSPRPPDKSDTRDHWRDRLHEFEYRLIDRLLAWEARSAAEADHRCDRISAAIRRGARQCLGRSQVSGRSIARHR